MDAPKDSLKGILDEMVSEAAEILQHTAFAVCAHNMDLAVEALSIALGQAIGVASIKSEYWDEFRLLVERNIEITRKEIEHAQNTPTN